MTTIRANWVVGVGTLIAAVAVGCGSGDSTEQDAGQQDTGTGGGGQGGSAGTGGSAGMGGSEQGGSAGTAGAGNSGGFGPDEVLAGDMLHPVAIALNADRVYVADAGKLADSTPGTPPKTGGGLAIVSKADKSTTWLAKNESVTAVVVTQDSVIFANADQGKIYRAALDGTGVSELVPDAGIVVDLAFFRDSLYFTETNCKVLPFLSCGGVISLMGWLHTASLRGSTKTTLWRSIPYAFLAVDASGVYVTQTSYAGHGYSGNIEFWSFATSGMHSDWVAGVPGGPYGIAINESHIYFSSPGSGAGVVGRAPLAGGQWEIVHSDEQAGIIKGPYTVAIDAENVYWSTSWLNCAAGPHNIWIRPISLSKNGKKLSDDLPGCPTTLAVDDSGVYWTLFDGGPSSVMWKKKQ